MPYAADARSVAQFHLEPAQHQLMTDTPEIMSPAEIAAVEAGNNWTNSNVTQSSEVP